MTPLPAPPDTRSITLRKRSLPAVVALLALLQLVAPYRAWTILLVGLVGAWLMGYLWARSLATGLRLGREIRSAWTQVGDEMLERFTLANAGWAPCPWVELIDHSSLPDYCGPRVVHMSGYEVLRWHQRAVCTRRGVFTLGPTSLQTGDPFGFYGVDLHEPGSATLVVMPPVLPLPAIDVAPGGRVGDGRARVNTLERTVSSASVRQYLPGDSLRGIHWPTTARLGAPYIRLFDSTPTGDWWIVLDMDRRVQAGRGQSSTEEHGVILAASLADRALGARLPVGLVTLMGKEELAWLPPRADEGQRWEILRALALAGPGEITLADLVLQAGSSFNQAASLILITPAAHGQWLEALLPLVRRGVVPTVLLLDSASFGGTTDAAPTSDLLSEMGIEHSLIHREMLEDWQPSLRPRPDWRGRRLQDDPWQAVT